MALKILVVASWLLTLAEGSNNTMSPAAAFDCTEPNPDYELMHGRYYKLSDGAMSFADAEAMCEAEGTRLAIAEDPWIFARMIAEYSGKHEEMALLACVKRLWLNCLKLSKYGVRNG